MGCPEPSRAPRSPHTLHPHLPRRSAPLPQNQGLWHLPLTDTDPWASQSPARSRPRLPGAWETKGSRNQTIFPLNLISSFSSTPPQLEVE